MIIINLKIEDPVWIKKEDENEYSWNIQKIPGRWP